MYLKSNLNNKITNWNVRLYTMKQKPKKAVIQFIVSKFLHFSHLFVQPQNKFNCLYYMLIYDLIPSALHRDPPIQKLNSAHWDQQYPTGSLLTVVTTCVAKCKYTNNGKPCQGPDNKIIAGLITTFKLKVRLHVARGTHSAVLYLVPKHVVENKPFFYSNVDDKFLYICNKGSN